MVENFIETIGHDLTKGMYAIPFQDDSPNMDDAGRKIADAIDRTALGWHEDILGLHHGVIS